MQLAVILEQCDELIFVQHPSVCPLALVGDDSGHDSTWLGDRQACVCTMECVCMSVCLVKDAFESVQVICSRLLARECRLITHFSAKTQLRVLLKLNPLQGTHHNGGTLAP